MEIVLSSHDESNLSTSDRGVGLLRRTDGTLGELFPCSFFEDDIILAVLPL